MTPGCCPPPTQGQSRRIQVEVCSVQDSGTMPLIAELILAVSVGCVEIQPAANGGSQQSQEDMDSYQVSDQRPVDLYLTPT